MDHRVSSPLGQRAADRLSSFIARRRRPPSSLKEGNSSLESLAFVSEKLSAQAAPEADDDVQSILQPRRAQRLGDLPRQLRGLAPRHSTSGTASSRSPKVKEFRSIPGRGNRLAVADIKNVLGGRNKPDLAVARGHRRAAFLPRVAPLLGVDPASLVLNQGRSGQPADHLWFVDFDVEIDGAAGRRRARRLPRQPRQSDPVRQRKPAVPRRPRARR